MRIPAAHAVRFWSKVAKGRGCWGWKDSCGSHGYGQFYIEHAKPLLAHRVSWQVSFGRIPHDKFVLHKCDNKKCVRPDHLFLGTQADNIHDMVAKGRNSPTRGELSGNAKLTSSDVAEIRRRYRTGHRYSPGNSAELAKKFSMTRQGIGQVALRHSWRHLP